jgi:hypothetical protein
LKANETTERARAEALFKKQEQQREGDKTMADYEVAQHCLRMEWLGLSIARSTFT